MTYKVVKTINADTLWLKQDTTTQLRTYFKLITSEINDLMMNNFQMLRFYLKAIKLMTVQ